MKNGAAQCVASPNSGGAVRHPSQDRLPTDLHSAGQLALQQRTADQPAQALQTSRFILFPLPLAANEAGPPPVGEVGFTAVAHRHRSPGSFPSGGS